MIKWEKKPNYCCNVCNFNFSKHTLTIGRTELTLCGECFKQLKWELNKK